jgi:hypothetical protein
VKYLILIHTNPESLRVWEELDDQQRMDLGRGHMALTESLAESGELLVSEGLADPAMAKYVSVREGRILISDGPFAEVKEHLAGLYLIECESIERAVEIAAKAPDAAYSYVEVRPVLDMAAGSSSRA